MELVARLFNWFDIFFTLNFAVHPGNSRDSYSEDDADKRILNYLGYVDLIHVMDQYSPVFPKDCPTITSTNHLSAMLAACCSLMLLVLVQISLLCTLSTMEYFTFFHSFTTGPWFLEL
jgi:hypothetical protein